MTRSRKTSWLMAAFVLLIGLYPTAALAQHDPAGRWEGAIDVPGMKIEVSVELAQSDGAWSSSIDVPAQSLHDLALENIAVDGAAVSFTITGVPGVPTFDGTLADDGLTLSGDFTQAGQPTYALEPYKEMEFNVKDLSGFSVRFVKQGEQVTEAVITQPNGVFTATRME